MDIRIDLQRYCMELVLYDTVSSKYKPYNLLITLLDDFENIDNHFNTLKGC